MKRKGKERGKKWKRGGRSRHDKREGEEEGESFKQGWVG